MTPGINAYRASMIFEVKIFEVLPPTERLPEAKMFERVDKPVTPRVPEAETFERVALPVTPRVPEAETFARVVAPATPSIVSMTTEFVLIEETDEL